MKIPPGWELPESIRNRLGATAGRQRAIIEEGHLLLILHALPEPNRSKRDGLYFWRSPDGKWKHQDRKDGLVSLQNFLKTYLASIDALDREQDQACSALAYLKVLDHAAPINRSSLHLYEAFQKAREGLPEAKELISLRDSAYEISRTADLLYHDTRNGLDCAIARRAEEQAEAGQVMAHTAHRLNVLVAIFFPLTAVTSFFGMNYLPKVFENLERPEIFWNVMWISLSIGVLSIFSLAKPVKVSRKK